jgi:hypothetical protein
MGRPKKDRTLAYILLTPAAGWEIGFSQSLQVQPRASPRLSRKKNDSSSSSGSLLRSPISPIRTVP